MPLTLNLQSFTLPDGSDLLIRVSETADGVQGNSASTTAAFSADGRYVVFVSYADNFVAGDSNGSQDVFRKDLQTGALIRVSLNGSGAEAGNDSDRPQISADGRYVVFESYASDLVDGDNNDGRDIFRKDLETGAIVRVSTSSSGAEADSESYNAQISADGRYVIFQSWATNLEGTADTNAVEDIFYKDLNTGVITRVSAATDGARANDSSSNARISADGRYAVFESDATNLVANDGNASRDIFVKDLQTGKLVCASTASDGTQANFGSYNAQVSANGRYVVFESTATNLVAGDNNNASDIYRKDLVTGAIERVSIAADGTQGDYDCYNAQISADGRYVVFTTDSRTLAPGDTNNRADVFRKDLLTGELECLSTTLTPATGKAQPNAASSGLQISVSDKGNYALFDSYASNLAAGDTNNRQDILYKNLDTGEIVQVSTAADGTQGNGNSMNALFSADGHSVIFESLATNLVASDTNGRKDVFVKNLDTNAIERVSVASDGAEANGDSGNAKLSSDGKYVLFHSFATNLVAGDTNASWDIFVKNLETDTLERISTAGDGTQANGHSQNAQFYISAAGRYVVFESSASNLVAGDTNNALDIFRKNLDTGEIVRISVSSAGTQTSSTGSSADARISADGKYVVFTSRATNLVAGDTNGSYDIFRKNLDTGVVERVSTNSLGEQAGGLSEKAQISSDARYVAFVSQAGDLVAGDSNAKPDIFLKDMTTGELKRVSVAADGTQSNGTYCMVHSVSDDGRYVTFTTDASNLVAGDTNNSTDVFRKDMVTGVIERLSMSNAAASGDELANGNSNLPQIRFDGHFIVFQSAASNLETGDTNGLEDIYLVDGALEHRQAMLEGRFADLKFGVGAASAVSVNWGDGTIESGVPVLGNVTFRHAYATIGTKDAKVTVTEGSQTWVVPYTIDLGAKSAARNTALADTLSGGAGADQLTGDGFSNILVGHGGNDALDGGAGVNTAVFSGARADYVITKDAAGTVTVTDKQAGRDGTDTLKSIASAKFADQTLDLGTIPVTPETGTGGTPTIPEPKILIGTRKNDKLVGGLGNDKLYGGLGNDVLTGGAGQDVFVFNTKLGTAATDRKVNFDKIVDFSVKDDTIWLDNKYMPKLGKGTPLKPGKLNKAFFAFDKAKDKNDFLVYSRKTGVLSYDKDGSGAGEAVEFALLKKGLKITYADFMII